MGVDLFAVSNYKSLRGLELAPGGLTVVVGPNGAGKSNLADSLDFTAEVYRHGLELAISRRGGYENIAYRRIRRSKQPISIKTITSIDDSRLDDPRGGPFPTSRFSHQFSFRARGYSIRAEFQILSEQVEIESVVDGKWESLLTMHRDADGKITSQVAPAKRFPRNSWQTRQLTLWKMYTNFREPDERSRLVPPTELLATSVGPFSLPFRTFTRPLGNLRVFRIQPSKARDFGVPTPRPELDPLGANLPAVIDLLRRRSARAWTEIMSVMRALMPGLLDISVEYTSNRTLGLLFAEQGIGRPWNISEVSDGTVQALALLVALFDERSSALVIEELENSLHPWIIRRLMAACRAASEHKQIILTSHSPIVVNEVPPESVYVLWRDHLSSRIGRLADLDPDFLDMWKRGDASTFEYLDSGAEAKAIPPEPSIRR